MQVKALPAHAPVQPEKALPAPPAQLGATSNVGLLAVGAPVYAAGAHVLMVGADKQYRTLFGAIAKQLTTERATQLNAKVDIDGETPEDAAKEFLVETKIIDG